MVGGKREEGRYAHGLRDLQGAVGDPVELRRKFNIKKGTRVNFVEDNGKIILQPVTREYIDSFCGIFKRKPGSKL